MDKVMITVAPVGAEATREENPNLPLTPEEIIEAVYEAWQAGAAIVHLHVRDPLGKPTQDPTIFRQVIEGVRQRCDIVIQVSTGGSTGMSPEERCAPLALKPEMATLTAGTVNFGPEVFSNPYPLIIDFARMMKEKGVKPEIEIFDAGMLDTTLLLVKKGVLALPLHFDFVLGVPGGMAATARNLVYLAESIPHGCTWSVAGIGRHELPLGTMAIAMGGHVRVGFEDNVYYEKGALAASNAQLVARIARLAKELGRPAATPVEARRILGLPELC
ncbi:MAG: 3-keto-5-aminohexanoate cleavage protein [Bacillota bacterium]|nr:3-keto-5-aminohexanoate cleavage protein [Bacillota bacterium]MDW7684515.1 3-keto-5-aminohexanoate cleavage protein [Bacillota bacterium]